MPNIEQQIKENIGDVKYVVDNLKTDVAVIKSELGDMKQSITIAIEKISDSMITLATVTEKLNNNLEEHKYIKKNIKEVQLEQDIQREEIYNLQLSHDNCFNEQQRAKTAKLNSPLEKAKNKLIEFMFVLLLLISIFIIYSNLENFLIWVKTNGISVSP